MIREKRAACAGCKAVLAWHSLSTSVRAWAVAPLCARCEEQAHERWEWKAFDKAMAVQRPHPVTGRRVTFERSA